jgi:hypothetical protein
MIETYSVYCGKCKKYHFIHEKREVFCEHCGSKMIVELYENSKREEPKQEANSQIETIKKQLEGSQISLRTQNPECNAQGHYCATSKKDGEICLSVASEGVIMKLKELGIEPKFTAKLCSKNVNVGKKRIIEESQAEDTDEEKAEHDKIKKETDEWINNVNNRTTTIHPTFEQAVKIKAILENKSLEITEEEKEKLREAIKAELQQEAESKNSGKGSIPLSAQQRKSELNNQGNDENIIEATDRLDFLLKLKNLKPEAYEVLKNKAYRGLAENKQSFEIKDPFTNNESIFRRILNAQNSEYRKKMGYKEE